MGKYDDILAAISTDSVPNVPRKPANPAGKYDDIIAAVEPKQDLSIPEIKRDYPARRAISKYLIHPAIEGGAMTVGGAAGAILGAPAGPVGSAAGATGLAATMYPPAKGAADAIDDLMGIGGRKKDISELERVLGDTTTGLSMELGGHILGKIPKLAEGAVKAGVPTLFGPSREAVAARMANPEAIKNAPSYKQLAERLPRSLDNISKAINATYDRAKSLLRTSAEPKEGAVPISQVTGLLNNLKDGLQVGETTVGSSDKAAAQKIGSLISDLNDIIKRPIPAPILGPNGKPIPIQQAETYIPEATLHKAIQRIRKDINFDDKSASVTNSVLTDVSGQLDAILKSQNPEYQKAIRPASILTKIYNDTKDKFNLTKRTGEGLQATDATISSLKSLPTERRSMSQKTMERVKAATGEDFTRASKNRAMADQFEGGNAQGTRRTAGFGAIGSALGAALGYPLDHTAAGTAIGGNIGVIAGMASDISGREVGANVVDAFLKARPGLERLPYHIIARIIGSAVAAQ